jgi:small-conductance mechanosensitive channel
MILMKSQIVNYPYPDPHYCLQTDLLVADERNLEDIRKIIINTVREIDGILTAKPINALVQEIGDGSLWFRVRWWISSYTDTHEISD